MSWRTERRKVHYVAGMRFVTTALAILAFSSVGCATEGIVRTEVSAHADWTADQVYVTLDARGDSKWSDALVLRAYNTTTGDYTSNWRDVGADLDILRNGEIVASLKRSGKENSVSLGPGTYEVEAQFDDGATFLIEEFSIARLVCYRRTDDKTDKVRPESERQALFFFRHHGARVWTANASRRGAAHTRSWLTLPRLVADYDVRVKTRVTWLKDGKERETTFLGPSAEEDAQTRAGYDYRPEYRAYSHLAGAWGSGQENPTHFAFEATDVSIPDDVVREGGAWTVRLVSLDSAPVEVDFDLGALPMDRRFGRSNKLERLHGMRRTPEEAAPSMPLHPRLGTPSANDVAWMAERDKELSLISEQEKDHGGGWYLTDPMPITPSLLRAAYRSPETRLAFLDFVASRKATGGTIDIAGSYKEGMEEGRTITQIDRDIVRSQAELDADSASENAYRRANAGSLRPRLQALVKKYGGSFKPEELPILP